MWWILLLSATSFVLVTCTTDKNAVTSPSLPGGKPWSFVITSGNFQIIRPFDSLTHRIEVTLTDSGRQPVAREAVDFNLLRGNAEVFAKISPDNKTDVRTVTDGEGRASVNLKHFGPISGDTCMVQAIIESDTSLAVTFTILVGI